MKGILGLGMPMVAVPVIAYFLPPTTAMMLLCFPILSTNFLQMQIQKGLGSLRFLPLLIFLVIGLIVGGRLIVEIELNTVSIIIAISIIFEGLFVRIWAWMFAFCLQAWQASGEAAYNEKS